MLTKLYQTLRLLLFLGSDLFAFICIRGVCHQAMFSPPVSLLFRIFLVGNVVTQMEKHIKFWDTKETLFEVVLSLLYERILGLSLASER